MNILIENPFYLDFIHSPATYYLVPRWIFRYSKETSIQWHLLKRVRQTLFKERPWYRNHFNEVLRVKKKIRLDFNGASGIHNQ
jgi:hypothetical protein